MPLPPAAAGEPPSTLEQIRRFNPWLSAEDPLELPLKLNSLRQDEYTFFRGTVDLYYDWCKKHCANWMAAAGNTVTLHGDVHLGNIGTYRAWTTSGADNRFGVVDLDETFEGPYQLDLLRGIMALRLAASDNSIDLSQAERVTLAERFLKGYGDALSGRVPPPALTGHDIVRSLLKDAREGDPTEFAEKYCEGKPVRRFRGVRFKKGRVNDIMTPVDERMRAAIVDRIEVFLESPAGRTLRNRWLGAPHQDAKVKVLDVVRWSRINSGGSQGVRKFLLLLSAPHSPVAPLILQLKEEPLPAAARAGLVKNSAGGPRAAEVAAAYDTMLEDPCWLVGHLEIEGRGYLVRTKDPFSEEPAPGDFKTRDAIMQGAQLLGETLGLAHRAALRRKPNGDERIAEITAGVRKLAPDLIARSGEALAHLHHHYLNLESDSDAAMLVKTARMRIEAAAKTEK